MDLLPYKPEEVSYIWNPRIQKFDVIDLKTGKQYDSVTYTPDPVTYSLQLADLICDGLRRGITLGNILAQPNMPTHSRLYAWLALYPEFKRRYEEARKQRAESFAEQALDIALTPKDKDDVPQAKLAIETLKWAAEKADPERFAKPEKTGNNSNGGVVIHLHTGVLEKPAPKDIVVDEFGNFQGFDDGTEVNREEGTRSIDMGIGPTISVSTERFRTYDDREAKEENSQEGEP